LIINERSAKKKEVGVEAMDMEKEGDGIIYLFQDIDEDGVDEVER